MTTWADLINVEGVYAAIAEAGQQVVVTIDDLTPRIDNGPCTIIIVPNNVYNSEVPIE